MDDDGGGGYGTTVRRFEERGGLEVTMPTYLEQGVLKGEREAQAAVVQGVTCVSGYAEGFEGVLGGDGQFTAEEFVQVCVCVCLCVCACATFLVCR